MLKHTDYKAHYKNKKMLISFSMLKHADHKTHYKKKETLIAYRSKLNNQCGIFFYEKIPRG